MCELHAQWAIVWSVLSGLQNIVLNLLVHVLVMGRTDVPWGCCRGSIRIPGSTASCFDGTHRSLHVARPCEL